MRVIAVALLLILALGSGVMAQEPSPEPLSPEAPAFDLPDLLGLTLEEAELAADGYDLIFSVRLVETDAVEAGTVISQQPAPGEAVEPGATIYLDVAAAPAIEQSPEAVLTDDAEGMALFLPRDVAGEQLAEVRNLTAQEVTDFVGGEDFGDLLLPYGKESSDLRVAFGRYDHSIRIYALRVEDIASDELAGVFIEALGGQLAMSPALSFATETIGELAVTVVRNADQPDIAVAFYPTGKVLFEVIAPDEMLASVLAELP